MTDRNNPNSLRRENSRPPSIPEDHYYDPSIYNMPYSQPYVYDPSYNYISSYATPFYPSYDNFQREEFPSLPSSSNTPSHTAQEFYPPGFAQQKPVSSFKKPDPNAVSFIPMPITTESDKFSLKSVLKDDPLRKGISLVDLSVNMNDPEKLSSRIASPFERGPLDKKEQPEFSLPACYIINKPILRIKMIGLFCTSTLFYVFYNMHGEMLQALAAEELYRRNWQYSPVTKLWYFETNNTWKTFDLEAWNIAECNDPIPNQFLSKEEVKVKKLTP